MFHNRKIHLAIVLSVLACYVLLVETCAPKIAELYYKFMRKEKPCTDTRRKTIRVGRNPVRTVVVHDFGAHEGKLT